MGTCAHQMLFFLRFCFKTGLHITFNNFFTLFIFIVVRVLFSKLTCIWLLITFFTFLILSVLSLLLNIHLQATFVKGWRNLWRSMEEIYGASPTLCREIFFILAARLRQTMVGVTSLPRDTCLRIILGIFSWEYLWKW